MGKDTKLLEQIAKGVQVLVERKTSNAQRFFCEDHHWEFVHAKRCGSGNATLIIAWRRCSSCGQEDSKTFRYIGTTTAMECANMASFIFGR